MRGGNRIGDAGLGEKVRLLALTAVLTTALALAASASAESLQIKHKPWHTLTTHQKVVVLKKQIHKDKCVIRFWRHHRELASASTTMGYKARTQTHWARVSLHIATKHLQALSHTTRYVGSGGFPPHHALWVCIGGHEGSPTSVNPNGHYGMLQMTYNWFGYIKGRASDYPQAVQEWAAEHAYKDNHYSYSFLYGQWFKWDGASSACARYG